MSAPSGGADAALPAGATCDNGASLLRAAAGAVGRPS
jgi:hypothetical protein